MRASLVLALLAALAGCGGAQTVRTTPDESGDEGGGATAQVGPEIVGTQWRWLESHCTEGETNLVSRGFGATLRVRALPAGEPGFMLVSDQEFTTELCAQTIIQRATPQASGDWRIDEESRVADPGTPECEGRAEETRPGEIRMRGEKLEVLVQRSSLCNGLEVRMVYEASRSTPLRDLEVVRHYVAHFNRRDAESLVSLFADDASVIEPFTVTQFTGPTRHDGKTMIAAYYAEVFRGVPWLAMKLESVTAGAQQGQHVLSWQYMDPRLEQPFSGRNSFTVGGGEIFQTQIEATPPAQ